MAVLVLPAGAVRFGISGVHTLKLVVEEMKEAGKNPYVERLAAELAAVVKAWEGGEDSYHLAQHILETIITPKNQKIHELTSELAKLQGQIHRLDKVLAVHNAGVCKDGESPIDCAVRLLSPVPDDLPKRDRP